MRFFLALVFLFPSVLFSQVAARVDGLAAGSYADGSTTGASHTNNVNWNSSVFVSATRGNNTTGRRANPLLPFASIAAANAAAISYDTIVVTDGNFIEQVVPRQNIPFYFNYGTTLSNSSSVTFSVPVSITNLTISGEGQLHNFATLLINCTSTNILHVYVDAAAVYGTIGSGIASARIRTEFFNGTLTGPSYSAIAPRISISPLKSRLCSVTFVNHATYPLSVSLYDCSTTNSSSPFQSSTATTRFFGGTFDDGIDGHVGTLNFNNTEIISWIYDDDAGMYGATVTGTYFKE